jgi:predicted transcriptional regulator
MLITPDQIRAARALLRLDQATLAHNAGISVVTLRRLEDRDGLAKVASTTVNHVREVLEAAGAEFIDRGVRRKAESTERVGEIKAKIDRIVEHYQILAAKNPPLHDDELWGEMGL